MATTAQTPNTLEDLGVPSRSQEQQSEPAQQSQQQGTALPPTPPGHHRVNASDGSVWDVPHGSMSAVQNIDQGATILHTEPAKNSIEDLGVPGHALSSDLSSDSQSEQPGVMSRIGSAAKSEVGNIASGIGQQAKAILPFPQDAKEHLATTIAGVPGLMAYRAGRAIVEHVENTYKSKKEDYGQAVKDLQNAVTEFHTGNYRSGIADVASATAGGLGATAPNDLVRQGRVRDIIQGTKEGGDLATPITKDVVDLGAAVAMEKTGELGGKLIRGGEAGTAGTEAAPSEPGFIKKVVQGEKVAQPAAKATLRTAAADAAADTGVKSAVPESGVRTFVDDTLAKAAGKEKSLYSNLNKAAGTDMKSLYERAEELQDALDDPTNIANKKALQSELDTVQGSITKGETAAKSSGVITKDALQNAKAATQQRFALQELKAKLFNNESVVEGNAAHDVEETIQTKSAIKAAERLNKPSKFAPEGSPTRLQQALGQDGANRLLKGLYAAQKTGESAIKARKVAGWLSGSVVGSGALTLYHELTK